MAKNRSAKMGNRQGVAGLIDQLRYHEASRQGLGLLLVLVCALLAVPGESRVIAGFVLAVLGQLWRIYAAGMIRKNKQLATNGAYSLVRHPLYLGNLIIILGFTLACGNWMVGLLVVFFLLFYYPAAIRYEDFKLEGIFGDDWRTWSQVTPAMIPTRLKWQSSPETTWSMRQSMIRNGEAVYSIYIVACAVLLWYRAAA